MSSDSKLNIGTELFRSFVAVADLRSYKQAAGMLNLSQPTISGHMRRLQEQLGVDLFDKRVPGVRLTAAGEMVVARARQILEIHDEFVRQLAPGMSASSNSVLYVGCPIGLRCSPLVPVIAELRARFPGAQVILRSDVAPVLIDQVRNGELHVCVAVTREPQADAMASFPERLVWVRNRTVPKIDSFGLPIIAPPIGTIARDSMYETLRTYGIAHLTTFQALHLDSMLDAIRVGMGFSAIMKSLIPANDASLVVDDAFNLPELPHLSIGVYTTPVPIDAKLRDMTEFMAGEMARSPMMLKPEAA